MSNVIEKYTTQYATWKYTSLLQLSNNSCNENSFLMLDIFESCFWITCEMPESFIAVTSGLVAPQNTCSCKWDWPTEELLSHSQSHRHSHKEFVTLLWGPHVWLCILLFLSAGVSCDACLKGNFRGRRFKCLICYDYDLCASCYESGATTTRHTTEHPMQCILTRVDYGKDLAESPERSCVA